MGSPNILNKDPKGAAPLLARTHKKTKLAQSHLRFLSANLFRCVPGFHRRIRTLKTTLYDIQATYHCNSLKICYNIENWAKYKINDKKYFCSVGLDNEKLKPRYMPKAQL